MNLLQNLQRDTADRGRALHSVGAGCRLMAAFST
jgi:hypothetical protein